MSGTGTTKGPTLDRWGLKPVRRGYVRGVTRNIRKTTVESAFGQMLVIEFDLFLGEDKPVVPVTMRGNDFSMPIYADWIADVADPDPTIRPLEVRKVLFPRNNDAELVSFFPGIDDPNTSTDRFWSIVAIVGPLVVTGALAWLILWHYGLM